MAAAARGDADDGNAAVAAARETAVSGQGQQAGSDGDPFTGRSTEDLLAERMERRRQVEHMRQVYPESLAVPITCWPS